MKSYIFSLSYTVGSVVKSYPGDTFPLFKKNLYLYLPFQMICDRSVAARLKGKGDKMVVRPAIML